MKVFISHSSKEKESAEDLCKWLEDRQVKCFLAPRDISAGAEYAEEIINGIDSSDAIVLLMSENANKSPHVLREVERAVSKSIPILIYNLEEVNLSKSMEYFLMTHQWISHKSGDDYDQILTFLQNVKEKKEEKSPADGPRMTMAEDHAANQTVSVEKNRNVKDKKSIKWILPIVLAAVAVIGVLLFGKKGPVPEQVTYSAQPGDTITFGNYNGEAIEWRVLQVDNEAQSVMLVAKNILTMKAVDAPESGKFNSDGTQDYWSADTEADTDLELQEYVRGSNDWNTSNIRTWLNSDAEVVKYEGQAPVAGAMSEKKNGYQNEPGFLHGFTEKERAMIKVDEMGDKVSLLSKEDIALFESADISLYAEPTQAAIEQDKTEWFNLYLEETDLNTYSYWLKDAVEGTSSDLYLISGGYTEEVFETGSAGLEGYGIRPVIIVELHSELFSQ